MDKIYKKYDINGIHIAWFAQNGLFIKYVDYLLDWGYTIDNTKKEIKNVFDNIDNNVAFISKKHSNKIRQKGGEIYSKINALTPKLFIISSIGGATGICEKVTKYIINKLKTSYDSELFLKKKMRIYFLIRKDDYDE